MTDAAGRTAVVGAGGFIGSALMRTLDKMQIPVIGFTRKAPFITGAGHLHEGVLRADTLFWLASSIRPATAESHGADIATDRVALTRLLDGLRAAGSITRVVTVGSGGTVYDPNSPSPHTEFSALAPANAYGVAMMGIESLVHAHAPEAVVLRVANAYGPGQPARLGQGVIAYWMSAIARDAPIHVLGPVDVARDYVYIDDVVDALVRVHTASSPPPVVNIGSGVATTLGNLVDLVRSAVAPKPVRANYEPGRSFDAPSTWLDVSLAAAELEWKPRTDLAVGLHQTWQHVNAR